jgi:hypothetical protein
MPTGRLYLTSFLPNTDPRMLIENMMAVVIPNAREEADKLAI